MIRVPQTLPKTPFASASASRSHCVLPVLVQRAGQRIPTTMADRIGGDCAMTSVQRIPAKMADRLTFPSIGPCPSPSAAVVVDGEVAYMRRALLDALRVRGRRREWYALKPPTASTSCYLEYRATIVEWLHENAATLDIHDLTFHEAVRYVDRFMSEVPTVGLRKMQLVAVCCLQLAIKYDERESMIPGLADLSDACNGAYSERMFMDMEVLILKQFKWSVTVATPLHFLVHFLDDVARSTTTTTTATREMHDVRVHAMRLIDSCLYANDLQFKLAPLALSTHGGGGSGGNILASPSLVAAATLLAARRAARMLPVWSVYLETLTTHGMGDLHACSFRIADVHADILRKRLASSPLKKSKK
jgi:hypothetical protein